MQLIFDEILKSTKKVCGICNIEKSLDQFTTKVSGNRRIPIYKCRSCASVLAAEKYKENKEHILRVCNRWRNANKERSLVNNRMWRKKNPEKDRKMRSEYRKKRWADGGTWKVSMLLRSRVCNMIKYSGGKKSKSAEALSGASWEFIRGHLESLFSAGMTWENYKHDGWHVDHHIPCAAWNLKDPHHQRACFNWRNLRPMWSIDNHKKRDHLPEGWQDYMAMLLEVTREPAILAK